MADDDKAQRLAAKRDKKLVAALKVIFTITHAEAVEIHSGDREPGMYVDREKVMGKGK